MNKTVKMPEEVREFFRRTGAIGGSARVPKGAAMLSETERKALAMRLVDARRKKAMARKKKLAKGKGLTVE